jgi:hypothetical protein
LAARLAATVGLPVGREISAVRNALAVAAEFVGLYLCGSLAATLTLFRVLDVAVRDLFFRLARRIATKAGRGDRTAPLRRHQSNPLKHQSQLGSVNLYRVRLHPDDGEVLRILRDGGNLSRRPDVLPATPA